MDGTFPTISMMQVGLKIHVSSCSKLLTRSERPDSGFMVDYQTYPRFKNQGIRKNNHLTPISLTYLDLRTNDNVDIYSLKTAEYLRDSTLLKRSGVSICNPFNKVTPTHCDLSQPLD